MKLRRSLLKDLATVRTFTGEGGFGAEHSPAITVRCDVDGWRRLVRSAGGEEVVSEQTLRLHPETEDLATGVYASPIDLFTPESRVEVRGRHSEVVSVIGHTQGGRLVMVEVTTT